MDFIPSLKFSADGIPDYEDYYDQIEDHASDKAERIKLINRLLLDEKQQPFMYQALLHVYGIEDESYNEIWSMLMSRGYSSIDQVIAECNLDLNYRNFNWVMEWSASKGYKEIVEMMIERGATGFDSAMYDAARGGHKEIVELMIVHGATDFNLAMYEAARDGYKEIVEMLIECGATYFNWVISIAAYKGHKEIVELMIEWGATNFNETMDVAARRGHQDIVDLLQPYVE